MLLTIDVGNTNTVLGVFDGPRLVDHWRIETTTRRTSDEHGLLICQLLAHSQIQATCITAIAVSSVVPPLQRVFRIMGRRYFECDPLFVGPGVRTGMPVLYDNPAEVGADRIVNAVAAYARWPMPLVIVDFGTATTFDVVSGKGEYLGGAICPGVTISMEALFQSASKLPRIELKHPEHVLGRNTIASMQSGIVFGYVGLVDGICARMAETLGCSPKVVATGGLAPLIASESHAIHDVDEFLTLNGLRILHERNS